MRKYFRYLLSLSPANLFRLAGVKVAGKDFLVSGSCNGCGHCCERINLRSHEGWIRTEKQFIALMNRLPEYKRFSIVATDKQGFLEFDCSKFIKRHGCIDYSNRPEICRRYPNKSLFLQGGQLVEGCGYLIHVGVPFARHLSVEMKKRRERA